MLYYLEHAFNLLFQYKLQVVLLLAIIDTFLIHLILYINNNNKTSNGYLDFHLQYGVIKLNGIKIIVAIAFLLFAPPRRDTVAFALIFIYVGIILSYIWHYFKRCKSEDKGSRLDN